MNAPFLLKPLAAAIRPRPYQAELIARIYAAWQAGAENVMAVLATGGGKTVVLSGVFSQHIGAGMLVAHRQELVGQICESLNKAGLRFRILAPKKTIAIITKLLLKKHGVCHYDPTAELGVAGIDTLLNTPTSALGKAHRAWLQRVTLGAIDESHHVTFDNKWGRGMALLPGCKRWLLPTASPCRGDGRGLGRKFGAKGERLPGYDGMADVMVEGPGTGDLIGMGYLTPFKVVCAKVSVNYEQVKIGASGEYVAAQLVAAEEHSGLLGDIVETYQKYAPGKRGVCFVSSIKRAEELAERFNAAGVPALALDGTTDDEIRSDAKDWLERGELKMLVNVDLFGEGYDLPAIEVVILGTKTASLGRYLQWCGRVLRLLLDYTGYDDLSDAGRLERIAASMKPFGLIIDHANNIVTHGLPDKPHIWSLEGGGSSGASDSDAIPLRACTNPGLALVKPGIGWDAWRKAGWTNEQLLEHGHATETGIPCAQPYEAFLRCCEFCGYMPEPKGRRDPAEVEGDLELLDEETMAAIRASYLEARQSIEHYRSAIASGEHGRMNHMMASANVNRHREKLEALAELDDAMARFGGKYRARGESDTQIQRRFYATFGVDVLTAASLKRADAEKLRGKIDNLLNGA